MNDLNARLLKYNETNQKHETVRQVKKKGNRLTSFLANLVMVAAATRRI
jgi:hypothetical protein